MPPPRMAEKPMPPVFAFAGDAVVRFEARVGEFHVAAVRGGFAEE